RGKRADDGIEHGNSGHLQAATALDQRLTQGLVDKRIEDDAGMGGDRSNDALDLALGANHRPDMLDRLGAFELHPAGPRHRVNGIAGSIRDQMEMKPGHAISPADDVEKPRLIPVLRRRAAPGADRSSLALFSKRISSPRDKCNPTVLVPGKSVIGGRFY